MGDRNGEVLLPLGVLRVGDDSGAGDGGAGEADLDVGVAGDDLAVVAMLLVLHLGAGGAAGGEAAAEALREHVHVGEGSGGLDPKVEISVEVYDAISGLAALCYGDIRHSSRILGFGREGNGRKREEAEVLGFLRKEEGKERLLEIRKR